MSNDVAGRLARRLAAVEQYKPDLALIDIGLPGLNGYEVARQIRENLGNTQIYLVALTGYGQSQDVQAAFQAGFDNHIVKPLDPGKLSHIIKMHRQRDRASAEQLKTPLTGKCTSHAPSAS